MDLTSAELTVLGLVAEQPRHGYDLEHVIEQRGIRQWTDIGFSSIYYILTKLERRGLIDVDPAAPASAKARRVFRVTGEGRRLAAAQTLAVIADPRPVPHPALVGIANLPLVAAADYTDALRHRLAGIEARIAAVLEAERAQSPLPPAAREVFSFSRALLEAERSWLADRTGGSDD